MDYAGIGNLTITWTGEGCGENGGGLLIYQGSFTWVYSGENGDSATLQCEGSNPATWQIFLSMNCFGCTEDLSKDFDGGDPRGTYTKFSGPCNQDVVVS